MMNIFLRLMVMSRLMKITHLPTVNVMVDGVRKEITHAVQGEEFVG